MKKTSKAIVALMLVTCLLAGYLAYMPITFTADAADYQLVWSDEFDGNSLNLNNWTYETGGTGWGNAELQNYTDRTDNARVADGMLYLTARKENYDGNNYTSARLITKDKFYFKYGHIEARLAVPSGMGVWPAYWMLGQNISTVSWPACGEIDLMEAINTENKVYSTCHWDGGGYHADYGSPSFDLDRTQFHVYTCDWTDKSITTYIDGVQIYTIDTTGANLEEFHKNFFFILNVAIGGQWPGYTIDDSAFPHTMMVDYIRVYQTNPDYHYGAENSGFSGNVNLTGAWNGWKVDSTGGGANSVVNGNNLEIDVTNVGGNPWSVQLYKDNLTLEQNQRYRVTVDLMSDKDRTVNMSLQNYISNYQVIDLATQTIVLKAGQRQTVEFFTNKLGETTNTGKLYLGLGQVSGSDPNSKVTVYSANVERINTTGNTDNGSPGYSGNTALTGAWNGWNVDSSGGRANTSVNGNDLSIEINAVGENPWSVQLYKSNVALQSGKYYKMSFDVTSTETRRISVALQNYINDYTVTDIKNQTITLNAGERKTIEIYTDLITTPIDTAKIYVGLGQVSGLDVTSTVTFHNASFVALDSIGNTTSATTGTTTASTTKTTTASTAEPTTATTQAPTGTNLALGKNAVSSGNALTPASYAVDGNTGSRWESAHGVDPSWMYVDLGSVQNINKVVINWEAAAAKAYQVQVSNDASGWQTVYTTDNGDAGVDTITFDTVAARYVRIYGTERLLPYGYSIWELEVYGTGAAATTTASTTKPTTATTQAPSGDTNLAKGKNAVSSGNALTPASYAVDGNTGSRWESAHGVDPSWMYVDLGAVYNVNKVVINWETAAAKAYQVQVSNDASNWATVYSTGDGDAGIDEITFDAVSARYVRIYGTVRTTQYGYSIWELEVYGGEAASVTYDPVLVEAENYTLMSGIDVEACSEGGNNVGWIESGDWLSYDNVVIPAAGTYLVEFRVASTNNGGVIVLEQNAGATKLGQATVPNTGAWQNWQTVSITVNLSAGSQTFGIGIPTGGYNLNWIRFTKI